MGMDSPGTDRVRHCRPLTNIVVLFASRSGRAVSLTSDRCAVHDLILGDGVVLVVDARPRARRLPLDDVDLHVLDLDPHQEEVDLSHDHVLQVVPARSHTATQVRGGNHGDLVSLF